MSIFFSKPCEYALQTVVYLAVKPRGEMTSIKELTERFDIPYHFLGKILQDLTKKKLLTSSKGPRGGFGLALPPSEITLFHIVDAIDGADFMKKCVLGFPECGGENPCAVHEVWGGVRDEIYQMLVNKTVEQVARETGKPNYALAR